MPRWPRYPVTVVGSWPRPSWLLEAMKRKRADLAALQDEATLLAVKYQEDAGVDIVSDGEQRRDNFYSFICDRMDGVRLMSMAELLDYVEDKAAFEDLLRALDVPAFGIKNPTAVGKLRLRQPLALGDLEFLREHTRKPVKVTLPGPYLLSRSMWVKALSEASYPTREALAEDVVSILRAELRSLADAGADIVQFDEPVLTELALAGKSTTRTFMCAALAASASPERELDFAVDLINRVVDGIEGPIIALHVCRGNWSQKEEILLQGSYDSLVPYFCRMKVRQFVLEFATPRAGSPVILQDLPPEAQVGFGAVNPRTSVVESPDEIVARVGTVAELIGPDRVFLNPDCGFGTFADRPVGTPEVAFRKLCALSKAAERLRHP
jgi:5-methyltetrahydropteroyltriglutamate--homocysteine methyltransferase